MTKKLFNCILTIWLLFSSLYLPAFADTAIAAQVADVKTTIKKSPEAQFLDGATCLRASNIPCVQRSLALIPSNSAYKSILEGALAFQQSQTDRALLLLLPIQTDDGLIIPAKILLHETLVQAFAGLGDVQQATQHLITLDALLTQTASVDSAEKLLATHEQIWRLLKPLNQNDLIALRGQNTDNIFQGWIDLTLATQQMDIQTSIASWKTLYPDHPAQNFADDLLKSGALTNAPTTTNLLSMGSIALMLPAQSDVDVGKLAAFKLGLETALHAATLSNQVEVYYHDPSAPAPEADYFVMPDFNQAVNKSYFEHNTDKPRLHLALMLSDEADAIRAYAQKNSMQHVTVVTTHHPASQPILASLKQAWSDDAEGSEHHVLDVITLNADLLAEPGKLLDLKSQIASQLHDMVILAMPALDVVKIRPYLDISTPTMTFSAIHDVAYENDHLKLLNALRFVEMPFLLAPDQTDPDHQSAAANLRDKTQLRWFALGVDSVQLLIFNSKKSENTTVIKGLAGNYSVTESGAIKRSMRYGRFNQNSAILD